MKFDTKMEKAIMDDLEARKARARFHGIKHDKYVAELEKEIEFYEYISKGEVPPTWIERYCEEDE
ncbi:hypothetical protein HB943_02105 [Listeria weihenstephanensis]|uniref:Antitoxin n=1 Tax=Listeria weihenstephanensis TaxID=1006155 RepID=A0A841Z299_9LIST|nr:hypothetical protein [Listeria weihenstephanensis]MBC1499380.1 hypothetical protein [Listeria weihenstephanensis]